ncbi:SDR family NAD(P)-dependent oxidoreductase [Mesorhizobium sp.]|uniref:SDR family NAD(P)-dependent oxidoreductase n=1 Tax=Mesorhizobium sp. TaxID=1871066 RepID=UPI0025E84A67|nr:SDR family NAD(P)-dependent oxidoreductase [Mesorhizobium sp.]
MPRRRRSHGRSPAQTSNQAKPVFHFAPRGLSEDRAGAPETSPHRQCLVGRRPVANPGASGYAATKFGVVGFSESLRRQVYADKVRVTVIEPGLVRSELGDHITNPAFKADLDKRLAAMEALTAEDIAAAILYAVSQPAHVNVNEIVIRPTDQER